MQDTDGWGRFAELTSGIDKVLKEGQDKLKDIKDHSYYQRKKTQVKGSPNKDTCCQNFEINTEILRDDNEI